MENLVSKIFNHKLPMEIVFKIKDKINLQKKKNQPQQVCYFCKNPVTYDEYIDGAGYICYGCTYY